MKSPVPDAALRFKRLDAAHLSEVHAIEQASYPDPWTRGMFEQELRSGASHFFLAFMDGRLVGYAGFWLVLDEAHITKVTVTQDYRCQGIGAALLRFLIAEAERQHAATMRLEVRELNLAARSLYKRHGFLQAGFRKGYYAKTGETAVVMQREVRPTAAP